MFWNLLLIVLSLATIARPQGDIGGTQFPPCTSSDYYSYKGCFRDLDTGPHMNFDFEIIPDTTVSDQNYPGYGTTMTPSSCMAACRGHGSKWAATYNGSACYCSAIWPSPNTTYNASANDGFPLYSTGNNNILASNASIYCNEYVLINPSHTILRSVPGGTVHLASLLYPSCLDPRSVQLTLA